MDAEGGGVGGWPEHGPHRRRQRHADPVTRQPAIAGRSQRDADLLDDAWPERFRVGVRASMGQVQHAGAHQGRRPVRGDVGEAHGRASRPARRPRDGRRPRARRGPREPRRAVRSCTSARPPHPVAGRVRDRSVRHRRPRTAVRSCLSSGGGGRRPRPRQGRRRRRVTPRPNAQVRTVVAGCGYADAARQRPGSDAGNGTGGA